MAIQKLKDQIAKMTFNQIIIILKNKMRVVCFPNFNLWWVLWIQVHLRFIHASYDWFENAIMGFQLKGANNAPFVITYVIIYYEKYQEYSKNISFVNWKKSIEVLYGLKTCCILLLCKDIKKISPKKLHLGVI